MIDSANLYTYLQQQVFKYVMMHRGFYMCGFLGTKVNLWPWLDESLYCNTSEYPSEDVSNYCSSSNLHCDKKNLEMNVDNYTNV